MYIDGVFALNAALDALLLSAAGYLTGRRVPALRLALGAALGGLYAAAAFLPGLYGLGSPFGLAAAGAAMLAVTFGSRLLGPLLALLGLGCGLAGGLTLAGRLLGGLRYSGGLPQSLADAQLLLLAGSAVWALVRLWLRGRGRRAGKLVPVLVEVGSRKRLLTALVDSGNTLTDPATGQGVLIAEWEAVAPLLPEGASPACCAAPAEHLEALARLWPEGRPRLLSCRTVGQGSGVLLAFTARRVQADGAERGSMTVAVTPVRLGGGRYQALLGL